MSLDIKSYAIGVANGGVTPTGNINITDTNSTDVTNYATAQVVDADLVAGNIKKDVDVLGVVGTYEGEEPELEDLTATANGTYTHTGKDGYDTVVVNVPQEEPDLEDITITTNGTYTHTGKDGYDEVVVNVPNPSTGNVNITSTAQVDVTNYATAQVVDADLVAGNIKKDVNILGVVGTMEGGGVDISNITLKGSPQGIFAYGQWDMLIPYLRTIKLEPYASDGDFRNLFSGSQGSIYIRYTDLSHITFDMSGSSMYNFTNISGLFYSQQRLIALPTFDWSGLSTGDPSWYNIQCSVIFYGCYRLRNIPSTFFTNIPLTSSYDNFTGNNSSIFSSCYSLRVHPDLSWFNRKRFANYSSNNFYYYSFSNCYALDEITNLPVCTSTHTSNQFEQIAYNCYRIKNFTFATDNGTPYTANWSSQYINLGNGQYIGYAQYEADVTENYNSGITSVKKVTDSASYSALKNDTDWYSCDIAYSRYNHDSAVNTINSLPDCSAGSSNSISFVGNSGSATDGGAINTLTASEIAVATAKGWTVTLN